MANGDVVMRGGANVCSDPCGSCSLAPQAAITQGRLPHPDCLPQRTACALVSSVIR
jgi:hypothetical protein